MWNVDIPYFSDNGEDWLLDISALDSINAFDCAMSFNVIPVKTTFVSKETFLLLLRVILSFVRMSVNNSTEFHTEMFMSISSTFKADFTNNSKNIYCMLTHYVKQQTNKKLVCYTNKLSQPAKFSLCRWRQSCVKNENRLREITLDNTE